MTLVPRDRQHIWHPYTPAGDGPDPLPVASAEGAWITLADGRRFFDAVCSWWVILHGHRKPELIEELKRQADRLDHVIFAGCTHEPAVRLAEMLADRMPAEELTRVFYSDNGSTAVEVGLKLARHAWLLRGEPRRARFLSLEGAYHGDTVGAMSVGERSPFFDAYEPMLFDAATFRDADHLDELLDADDGTVAAVIVEPMLQGAAGMVVRPPEELRAIRERCDAHGVYLIADEVFTGFGRTGRMFACEHAGITPDILCLAKGITGGLLPLGATVATEEIWDLFAKSDAGRTFYHGHTFAGHPLACAVACRNLEVIDAEDTPGRLDALGRIVEAELAPLADHPRIRNLRRLGGVTAFDIASGEAGYHDPIGQQLKPRFIERGALVRPLGNVVYVMPPACTTDDEARDVGRIVREEVAGALVTA